MNPVVIGDDVWIVNIVSPGNPLLVDRTGNIRLATTDGILKTINISSAVIPPLLDKVLLHEITHAITVSYELLDDLHASIPPKSWINVEEWLARFSERYGLEAVILASQSLGRPLCIMGYCLDQY